MSAHDPRVLEKPHLMQGAFTPVTPAIAPAIVYISATFGDLTPDTASGGTLVYGDFTVARAGDTSEACTVSWQLVGRAPRPVVVGDLVGPPAGLPDVAITFPAGSLAPINLQVAFAAQDLYDNDHYGRVQLHGATGANIGGSARFDFALLHNKTTVGPPPPAYALTPDWTQKWAQHTTPTGVVSQLAAGVELAAGAGIGDDNATLVSKDIHSTPGSPVTPGAAPLAGWTAAADLMLASNPLYHPISNLADMAMLGTMQAGHQYVLLNDINMQGHNIDLAGGSLSGAACYFRGASPGRVVGAYPKLTNGSLTLKCSKAIVREIAPDGVRVFLGRGWNTVQLESLWLSGVNAGMDTGFVHANAGASQGTGLLIAFCLCKARPGKEISAPLLRIQGPKSPNKVPVPLEVSNVRVAFNHYHRLHTGPDIGPTSSGSKAFFFGDNPWNDFLDQKGEIDHNLFTDWTSAGQSMELKIAGWKVHDNTLEMGTPAPYPLTGKVKENSMGIKLRHSRVTSDPAALVTDGYAFDVDGNLSIFPTAASHGSIHDARDGFVHFRNNWGVILGPGLQPPAWAAAVAGPLQIQLNDGWLDWRNYPANEDRGGGNNWPNCGKCMVGGNFAAVEIGSASAVPPGGSNIGSDECRVAPGGGGRTDRNRALKITHDRPSHATDQTTPVPGASVFQVPHRMQALENGFAGTPEVGAAGWNAAAYSGGGGGGSGDLDVSFDYTCTATPAATDGNGCASLFYCHMVGQGAYPADMSAWSAVQWGGAGDTEYQAHADWFRFTFNTLNTQTPALSNKARLVVVSGGALNRPPANEAPADFFFPVGTTYRLRCRKVGNDFSFTQSTLAGVLLATQTWTDATAGAMNTGNLLWRFQPARHGKIENLTVA